MGHCGDQLQARFSDERVPRHCCRHSIWGFIAGWLNRLDRRETYFFQGLTFFGPRF